MAGAGTMRALGRVWGARDGGAAIEFAFALPVCAAMMLAVIELATVLFAGMALEAGVREAARYGVTGRDAAAREGTIRAIVDRHSFGLFSPADLAIDTRVYDRFDHIGQPEPYDDSLPRNGRYDLDEHFTDMNGNGVWDPLLGRPGAGASGEIVVYTARIRWQWLTGFFAPLAGDGVDLRASLVVRNEPFDTR